MTAFSQAWAIVKNWTPDWRNQAALLGDLEWDEMPEPMQDEENYQLPGFLGEGTKVGVFEHPYHSDFVVKVPYGSEQGPGMGYSERIFETRNERDSIVEILERLGYPLMGELQNPEGYSIQPRLPTKFALHDHQRPDTMGAADAALMHLVNDRHRRNWGYDNTMGKVRNFDIDSMGHGDDWFPWDDNQGQTYQNKLDEFGIQHPATKLLNIIPEVDRSERDDPNYRLQSFRNIMELIEPYSDNPNTLTVDGKPIWLEENV